MSRHRGFGAVLALAVLLAGQPLCAQGDEPFATEEEEPRYRLGLEVKTHYRDSDERRLPSPFPFPAEFLPPGQTRGFMETAEAGDHVEVSVVSIEGLARWREDLEARVKIDFIDRYDRNPTSEDREVDVDEAWLRFGHEAEPAEVPERRGWYAKLGKFGKFERQDDRHLESYGHVSTAFNRLEDVGLELGVDLTRNLYLKASLTQGNPLFFRDSNSLAGDNGIGDPPNPDGTLPEGFVRDAKTGFPVLYDADVDTIDFSHPEVGLGLGWRWSSLSGFAAFDLLAWGYERELDDEVPLANTFYGGDLDLLNGPIDNVTFSLPISGDEKREVGVNLWLYLGGFTFFGQWVDSEAAGLSREGLEVELSWTFDLPWWGSIGSRQIFPWISPALRYSELDIGDDFFSVVNPAGIPTTGQFPAPSVAWDWEKLDVGLAIGVIDELDVTVEWTANDFVLFNGTELSLDEFLVTLRLALEKTWPAL